MKVYTILRTVSLNANTLEVDRLFGFFQTREEAETKAEALFESIQALPALKGFCFTFFVREVLIDG